MLQSRWGRRIAALYLLIVAFAGGFITYHVLFAPRSSQFLAILVIIAGMPWSVLLGRALDPDAAISVLMVITVSIALNALLLYWCGAGLEYFRSRKTREAR